MDIVTKIRDKWRKYGKRMFCVGQQSEPIKADRLLSTSITIYRASNPIDGGDNRCINNQ